MSVKPDWDEYFLGMLKAVSQRASCDRGRSAAVLVKNNRIISTGYVGAPAGLPSCDEIGHLMEVRYRGVRLHEVMFNPESHVEVSEHCIRTFHAEMNAILSCAKEGVSTLGATMYCTMVPCRNCAMAIIQSGIVRVVAAHQYQSSRETCEMFGAVNPIIELKVINEDYLY